MCNRYIHYWPLLKTWYSKQKIIIISMIAALVSTVCGQIRVKVSAGRLHPACCHGLVYLKRISICSWRVCCREPDMWETCSISQDKSRSKLPLHQMLWLSLSSFFSLDFSALLQIFILASHLVAFIMLTANQWQVSCFSFHLFRWGNGVEEDHLSSSAWHLWEIGF